MTAKNATVKAATVSRGGAETRRGTKGMASEETADDCAQVETVVTALSAGLSLDNLLLYLRQIDLASVFRDMHNLCGTLFFGRAI